MTRAKGYTKKSLGLSLLILLPAVVGRVSDGRVPPQEPRPSAVAVETPLPAGVSILPSPRFSDPDSFDAVISDALERWRCGRFQRALVDSSDTLRARIQAVVARPSADEWAGLYYYGNGLGDNVRLAVEPDAGFSMTRHGCLGLYDLAFGTVEWGDSLIVLRPSVLDSRYASGMGIPSAYVRVRWGRRHYLISPGNIVRFCNLVNAGWEPGRGLLSHFLLKSNEGEMRVTGLPEVPQPFRQYLARKPITARITEVLSRSAMKPQEGQDSAGNGQGTNIHVLIDAGQLEGLHPRMTLFTVGEPGSGTTVTIGAAGDHKAIGVIESWERKTPPALGCRLSTRDPHEKMFRPRKRRHDR